MTRWKEPLFVEIFSPMSLPVKMDKMIDKETTIKNIQGIMLGIALVAVCDIVWWFLNYVRVDATNARLVGKLIDFSFSFSILQLIYVVPLAIVAKRRQKESVKNGIITAFCITFLLTFWTWLDIWSASNASTRIASAIGFHKTAEWGNWAGIHLIYSPAPHPNIRR
jgi:hypothetical protein